MPEIALATRDDIVGMLDLQEKNLLDRGGLLTVRLPAMFFEAALDDQPQIVARRDTKIVGYLLARSRAAHAEAPIIQKMFRALAPILGLPLPHISWVLSVSPRTVVFVLPKYAAAFGPSAPHQ